MFNIYIKYIFLHYVNSKKNILLLVKTVESLRGKKWFPFYCFFIECLDEKITDKKTPQPL